jgi:NADPH-dependent curcumin reductase CurA
MEGLHVVGSAGDDRKVDYLLKELEFDGAFNYKKESPSKALPRLCPNGIGTTTLVHLMIDIYWENVGGETLDAVLVNANNFSRIIGCGMISSYGETEPYGVKNLLSIILKRIRFEGFIQSDLREKYSSVRSILIFANSGFHE